jgi:16S rRNA (uracil1498-N3)-methyltransferase
MQQFYTPDIDADIKTHAFNENESKHIARVLRKKSGDTIRLTNGKGLILYGILEVNSPKHCSITITSTEFVNTPETYVHIAVAPTKNMDRFEWFLEKATELGVQRITPILCDRSERKVLKTERCEKIIEAALKQSLRAHKPILDPLTPLKELNTSASISCIAHCENTDKEKLQRVVNQQSNVCILIGPEGDFSKKEITWAKELGIKAVDLGKARLRTETAALVACHTVLLINES